MSQTNGMVYLMAPTAKPAWQMVLDWSFDFPLEMLHITNAILALQTNPVTVGELDPQPVVSVDDFCFPFDHHLAPCC